MPSFPPNSSEREILSRTLGRARLLAASRPDAMLPCPACAASVRAKNLDDHVAKVHPAFTSSAPPDGGPPLVLPGTARFLRKPLGWALVLWSIAFAVVVERRPHFEDVDALWIGGSFLMVFAPLLAAALDVIPARLVLDGTRVRLITLFGFEARSIELPCGLEGGSLVERLPSANQHVDVNDAGREVRAGAYVRLSKAGSALTIGGRRAAGLGEHWSDTGWRKGAAARGWDVTLDRAGFVAVQLHLASVGALELRTRAP